MENKIIILLIFFVFFIFGFQLFNLQIINGNKYYYNSNSYRGISKDIPNQRGLIFDRNMNIIASNRLGFEVNIANLDKKYFESINEVEEFIREKKDFEIKNITSRIYSNPLEFSHIIGYVGAVNEEDLKKGYRSDEIIGKYKIEKSYEELLKGAEGYNYVGKNNSYYIPGTPGADIILTIDKNWQVTLYKIIEKYSKQYGSAGGAGVILDSKNGEIIANVSYPGFDSNTFIKGVSTENYNLLANSRNKELVDKTVSFASTPGSIFKLLTSYYLLENKIIDKDSTFYSNRCMELGIGYQFCEFGKFFYGSLNLRTAISRSSNLFFCNYSLGKDMNNLANTATKFGLGTLTGVDISGEISGQVDSPLYKYNLSKENWYSGDTCNLVIGQGATLVTPMQMAKVASILDNGGEIYRPYLVKEIRKNSGEVLKPNENNLISKIDFSGDNLDLIRFGMRSTAQSYEGTVYPFLNNLPGDLRVKTGTAEVFEGGEMKTHGWIIGSFNYENKSYSFAFALYFGGGGFYISQIAKDFINCIYNNFNQCI